MNPATSKQRTSLAAATLLARASATTVALLLPVRLVLDIGLGPAAYGALAGVATAVYALTTLLGRYLSIRTPGRLAILWPASLAAAALSIVLASSTTRVVVSAALLLGVAALGTSRPAWQSLVEVSAASGPARWGARLGCTVGVATALAISTRPAALAPGMRIGACYGVLGLLVLVVLVEDSRAPLAPRRCATLLRCSRAWAVARLRTTAVQAAVATAVLAAGTVASVAAVGQRPHPTVEVGVLALGLLCHGGAWHVLGARAAAAVVDELEHSARAVAETAALLGGAAGALVAALCVRVLG